MCAVRENGMFTIPISKTDQCFSSIGTQRRAMSMALYLRYVYVRRGGEGHVRHSHQQD
jgi:hypothetical protein